jgi:uncharacterized membrane protein YtjA (UPF0391 family)
MGDAPEFGGSPATSGGYDDWLGYNVFGHRPHRGVLGFGGVAGTAFSAAKIIFVVALIAFLISGVLGYTRRGAP